MPYGSICCTHHRLKYLPGGLLTAEKQQPKNKKQTSVTQPVPYGSTLCCTYHRLKTKYSPPNRYKKKPPKRNKRHIKEPTIRKMEVQGTRGQENGQNAEKDQTEWAT